MPKYFTLIALVTISLYTHAQFSIDVAHYGARHLEQDSIVPTNYDIKLLINPVTISFSLVTELDFNFSVDGGPVVTEHATGQDIQHYSNYFYQADYPKYLYSNVWHTPSAPGMHVLKMWTSNPNGQADSNPTNDTVTYNIEVAGPTVVVPRVSLLENFTSTSCGPCDSYDNFLHRNFPPLHINEYGSSLAAISYHTNIPGADPSYNADVSIKQNHYSVGGNPLMFADHYNVCTPVAIMLYPDSTYLKVISNYGSFVDMDATYGVINDSVWVTVNFTPLKNYPADSFTLNIAVVEQSCNYHTFPQDFVMRKMLPDANGTLLQSMTAQVPQSFTYGARFTTGNVTGGSYNLWEGMSNVRVIASIAQNRYDNEQTLQTAIAHPVGWNGLGKNIETIMALQVYPNPTHDVLYINCPDGINADNLQLTITDLTGRLVNKNNFKVEGTNLVVNTKGLNTGLYYIALNGAAFKGTSKFVKE